jgi:hypothetical protein
MQLAGNLDLLMLLLLEEEVTATPSLSPETALLSLSQQNEFVVSEVCLDK